MYPTLCDLMNCSPPGSCPLDFPGRNTGVGCHFLLQGVFPTQGSNPCLLYCRQILYHLSHQGSPREGSPGKAYCPWWSQREASRAVSQFDCPVGDLRDISSRPTQALLYLKNAKTLLSLKTTQKQMDWIWATGCILLTPGLNYKLKISVCSWNPPNFHKGWVLLTLGMLTSVCLPF